MLRPVLFALLATGGCGPKAPPATPSSTSAASARPGRVEVLHRDDQGRDRVARRQRSDDACDWELLVAEGQGWATWARVPGLPRIVPGPGGELVVWATCEGDHLDHFTVADSPDLHGLLPEGLAAVRWVDENTVEVEGRDPGDRLPRVQRLARTDAGWVEVPASCVVLAMGTDGVLRREGRPVSPLLWDDLNDDDVDELVIEEPDSCGTALCAAVVYTRCPGADLYRPMGRIDHRDGITRGPTAVGGWRTLHSASPVAPTTWQVVDGAYVAAP